MNLDLDAPEITRASVSFRNGRAVLISADKAASDAQNFRFAADLIGKGQFSGSAKENATRVQSMLRSLADQFDAALSGESVQAK